MTQGDFTLDYWFAGKELSRIVESEKLKKDLQEETFYPDFKLRPNSCEESFRNIEQLHQLLSSQ